jgi:flavin-dependent dehydrogenase
MNKPAAQYDVAIVGAGPAGSSAAIRLAGAGLSVILIEKAKFPREKLCGEFISPECGPHFDELGLNGQIDAVRGAEIRETVFYAKSGRSIAVPNEWFGSTGAPALGLSRAEMDSLLLDRAAELGVVITQETSATGLLFDNDGVSGVTVKNPDKSSISIGAKVTVDATGRARVLTRHIDKTNGKAAEFVAFKTHLTGAKTTDDTCEIYGYQGGYGGCVRVENGYHNLCFIVSSREVKRVGSDPEHVLREIVCTNPRAAEVLGSAVVAKPWLAVPIEGYGRGKLVPANGLITVGDAGAFIDPFTGSGILMALESGKIAAAAIVEGVNSFPTLANLYRAKHSATFDRRFRTSTVLRRAAFVPLAAELTVGALTLSSGLRRRLARATRGR